ncbi:DNA methyltransferase [Bradyrhizobium sp. Arg314]
MHDEPESPKHTPATRRGSIYPYYAGYSEQFVESILRKINASEQDTVLDPWNGSGTTTAVCTRMGIRSFGVDINPAMKPIAAVRSMRPDRVEMACDHAIAIINSMEFGDEETSLFELCGMLLKCAKKGCDVDLHDALRFGFMVTCRALARSIRSKNPTWFSLLLLKAAKFKPEVIAAECLSSFSALSKWKTGAASVGDNVSPHLTTADWSKLRWRTAASHIITSPPYLTRIDYVMKTLPELLLLNAETPIDLDALRRAMLGSVLTLSGKRKVGLPKSSIAASNLEKISSHKSKASSAYYLQFFSSYFLRLENSLKKITNSVDDLRTITIVTQGSYYKEIFVDVPAIVDEILRSHQYKRISNFSFLAPHNMITVNSRSVASGFSPPPEYAATYERSSL